jgi:adenylate kinase family enzyme
VMAVVLDMSTVVDRIDGSERIHIIGGPGSGKSTLSRILSKRLSLPVFELDSLAFEGPEFTRRPAEVTTRGVEEIVTKSRWITEGIFVGWTEPLLERADVILWLDYTTWPRAARRIVTRTVWGAFHAMRARRGRDRFLRLSDYARNMRQLVFVVIASREYWSSHDHPSRYPVTRNEVARALGPYEWKVIRVSRERDAEALAALAAIGCGRGQLALADEAG